MIRGICNNNPDYALIMIDPIKGITSTTREHFRFAFAFGVPVIIIIVKIDLVSECDLTDFY